MLLHHVFVLGFAHLVHLKLLSLEPAWQETLGDASVVGDVSLLEFNVSFGAQVPDGTLHAHSVWSFQFCHFKSIFNNYNFFILKALLFNQIQFPNRPLIHFRVELL